MTVPTPAAADDPRLGALSAWLARLPPALGLLPHSLRPASSDASFRRYFRLDTALGPRIAMDAPPPHEDVRPFVHVAHLFAAAGAHVPAVLAQDVAQGFLLLEDLGHQTLLDALDREREAAWALYPAALRTLVAIQRGTRPDALPPYDAARLRAELQLFPDWYVARHCAATLSTAEQQALAACFDRLVDNALAQPQVWVHRDYHARNLMLASEGPDAPPGVLDFQDAVLGPITYDAVSLLRDAYIAWDEAQQVDWLIRWWELARAAGLPVHADFGDVWRDFEWVGLQRQLKVLGIFARLAYRDGKQRYLADLPRVLGYAQGVARRYGAFAPLARLLDRLQGAPVAAGYTF